MKKHNPLKQIMLVISTVSQASCKIVLTVLHQVVGWEKDDLLFFEKEYIAFVRAALISHDKKALERIRKVKEVTNIDFTTSFDVSDPVNLIISQTWRTCLYCSLALLYESDATSEALKYIADCFGDWVKAYNDAQHGDDVDEKGKVALELMFETLHYLGKEEKLV